MCKVSIHLFHATEEGFGGIHRTHHSTILCHSRFDATRECPGCRRGAIRNPNAFLSPHIDPVPENHSVSCPYRTFGGTVCDDVSWMVELAGRGFSDENSNPERDRAGEIRKKTLKWTNIVKESWRRDDVNPVVNEDSSMVKAWVNFRENRVRREVGKSYMDSISQSRFKCWVCKGGDEGLEEDGDEELVDDGNEAELAEFPTEPDSSEPLQIPSTSTFPLQTPLSHHPRHQRVRHHAWHKYHHFDAVCLLPPAHCAALVKLAYGSNYDYKTHGNCLFTSFVWDDEFCDTLAESLMAGAMSVRDQAIPEQLWTKQTIKWMRRVRRNKDKESNEEKAARKPEDLKGEQSCQAKQTEEHNGSNETEKRPMMLIGKRVVPMVPNAWPKPKEGNGRNDPQQIPPRPMGDPWMYKFLPTGVVHYMGTLSKSPSAADRG
jgi:hypothetical protein